MEKLFTKSKTAVIFEDHKIFADSFAMLLERTGLFSVVQSFSKEEEVMGFFVQNQIENSFLFMDYFIPSCNTIYVMNDIRRFCPTVKVVIVSSVTNPSLIRKILLNKIDGFISKTDGTEEVLACLRALSAKESYYSPKIKQLITEEDGNFNILDLTSRELEVLTHLSWSKSVDQISELLSISKHTVITHRRNLLAKSGCNSVTELVAYAIRAGLIAHD